MYSCIPRQSIFIRKVNFLKLLNYVFRLIPRMRNDLANHGNQDAIAHDNRRNWDLFKR